MREKSDRDSDGCVTRESVPFWGFQFVHPSHPIYDIPQAPGALGLRRMQMVSEVGIEINTTTIVLMPSEFVTLAGKMAESLAPA